uniref:MHD1 domain-containing protein n=1 Tax=Amorphochlora amoebiformis TaxID=1561963 RepID=A0A7S0CP68_9EUKA
MALEIRKLEKECTRSRASVRTESARLLSTSTTLDKTSSEDEKRRHDAHKSIDMARNMADTQLQTLTQTLQEAKSILKSAQEGTCPEDSIHRQIDKIRYVLEQRNVLLGPLSGMDEKTNTVVKPGPKPKETPALVSESSKKEAKEKISVPTKIKILEKSGHLAEAIAYSEEKVAESPEDLKKALKQGGLELSEDELKEVWNAFQTHQKIDLRAVMVSIVKLDSQLSVQTLATLSPLSRRFLIVECINDMHPDFAPSKVDISIVRHAIAASQEDTKLELQDMAESYDEAKLLGDIKQALALFDKWPPMATDRRRAVSPRWKKLQITLGFLGTVISDAKYDGKEQREKIQDNLAEYEETIEPDNLVKATVDDGVGESAGVPPEKVNPKDRSTGIRKRIFDQRKRQREYLARLLPSDVDPDDDDQNEEPKVLDLKDFLDKHDEKTSDKIKFYYQRSAREYIAPMAINSVLYYHSFKPKADLKLEKCLSKLLALFNVSEKQLGPLWDAVEPEASFMEEKGKQKLVEELERQVQREKGFSRIATQKMIDKLREEIREIRIVKEDKKRRSIGYSLGARSDSDDSATRPKPSGFLFFCCGSSSAQERAELAAKARREREIEERNAEILRKEQEELEEQRRRRELARKAIFENATTTKENEDEKPLPDIPLLTPSGIVEAYYTLHNTLLELDNAVNTGRWREFGDNKSQASLAEKLYLNSLPTLDADSKSILNRFSLVYNVHSVYRFLHAIEETFNNMNLRNIGAIMEEICYSITLLKVGFSRFMEKKAKEQKEEKEAKTEGVEGKGKKNEEEKKAVVDSKEEPDDQETWVGPQELPDGLFKRTVTLAILNESRPIGSQWGEIQQNKFLLHVCRTFQFCVWCMSKYHVAFALERKDMECKGFKVCLKLIEETHDIINSYYELAKKIFIEDEKYTLNDEQILLQAAAGYAEKERPFFVTHTPTGKGGWPVLAKQPWKEIVIEKIRIASHQTFNDFVTLTEPKNQIYGNLEVRLGKVSRLFQSARGKRITYHITVGGHTRKGASIDASTTKDFGGIPLNFNSVSINSPVIIEVFIDNVFTNELIESITLDLFTIYRKKETPEDVKLEDVRLNAPASTYTMGSKTPTPRTSSSIKKGVTLSFRNQKDIQFNHKETYPLGYPAEVKNIKGVVDISLDFHEDRKAKEARKRQDSKIHTTEEIAGVHVDYRDVQDAPQLSSIVIALQQELESDVVAQNAIRHEFKDLNFLNISMEEYFVSIRIGLQLLLRRIEYENESNAGSAPSYFSFQMLELYRLMKSFIEILRKSGYDLRKGADKIEPMFEPYVTTWINEKKNLLRISSVPYLLRDEKWISVSREEGDEDDEMRHSKAVVSILTILTTIRRFFEDKLPYTPRNKKELMQMITEVYNEAFIDGIGKEMEKILVEVDNGDSPAWGTKKGDTALNPLVNTIPDKVPVMLNTVRVAVGELREFVKRAMDEKKYPQVVGNSINLKGNQGKLVFEYYGMADTWTSLLKSVERINQQIARRIGREITKIICGMIKERSGRKELVGKEKDLFRLCVPYLDAFFIPWARSMYDAVHYDLGVEVLECIVGPETGIERILLDILNDKPPSHYQHVATFLLSATDLFVGYFGRDGLNIPIEYLGRVANGSYKRLRSIYAIISQPSKILIQEGGISDAKREKILTQKDWDEHEEIRIGTPPYIFRSTVMQILKYRYYKMGNEGPDRIPFSFILKNKLKKGLFSW